VKKGDFGLCLLLALACALAGCGGGSEGTTADTGAGQGASAKTDASNEKPADRLPKVTVVFRAESENLGRVLYDEDSVTLYFFTKDKGPESTCYGACAKAWPPYLTRGRLKARAVIPKQLGTTKRKDDTLQVTYFGHPLYYYSGDKGGAEYNGQGARAFGGRWYTIHPNGQKAEGSG
jgi:predicted lipoprotein with Yx(FWY)xxD motif